MTTTTQFTLSERNGLVYKQHPRFLAQNLSKKVRLIHESLRYINLVNDKIEIENHIHVALMSNTHNNFLKKWSGFTN